MLHYKRLINSLSHLLNSLIKVMTLNKSRILTKYQHDNQTSTSTVSAYISNQALSLRALTIYIIMNKSHGSRFCYGRLWTYCRTWLILTRTAGFRCAVDNTSVSQPERADHAPPVSISHTPLSVYTVLDCGVYSWSQRVSRYRQGRSHAVVCVHCAGLRCVQLGVGVWAVIVLASERTRSGLSRAAVSDPRYL